MDLWLHRNAMTGKLYIGTCDYGKTPDTFKNDTDVTAWIKNAAIVGFYSGKLTSAIPDIEPGQFIRLQRFETVDVSRSECGGC